MAGNPVMTLDEKENSISLYELIFAVMGGKLGIYTLHNPKRYFEN